MARRREVIHLIEDSGSETDEPDAVNDQLEQAIQASEDEAAGRNAQPNDSVKERMEAHMNKVTLISDARYIFPQRLASFHYKKIGKLRLFTGGALSRKNEHRMHLMSHHQEDICFSFIREGNRTVLKDLEIGDANAMSLLEEHSTSFINGTVTSLRVFVLEVLEIIGTHHCCRLCTFFQRETVHITDDDFCYNCAECVFPNISATCVVCQEEAPIAARCVQCRSNICLEHFLITTRINTANNRYTRKGSRYCWVCKRNKVVAFCLTDLQH